jgi:AcrR family transcriptional regulator
MLFRAETFAGRTDGVVVHKELKEARRNQILFFAKQVFSQKGYHNASVSDIIESAGIARGTFYLYFTSKRDIFDSLLDEVLKELRQRIRPIDLSPGAPDPLVQVKANIGRVLEFLVRDPELTKILLHQAAGLDERSAAMLHAFYDRVLSLIERSLEHGIRMGLVRPCQTRIVASCILGTMKEVADQLTTRQADLPPLEVVVEELFTFGLRGVFARSATS